MVSTTQSRTDLATLFNDNAAGDITAGDLRQGMINILDDIDTLNGETTGILVNAQTGTSYTLTSGDSGKLITMSSSSANSVVVPNNLPVGFVCTVAQIGTGLTTIANGAGATVNSRGNIKTLANQYAPVSITVYANGTGTAAVALLSGDLA